MLVIGASLHADVLAGKSVKVKEEGKRLGTKTQTGLIRDGEALSRAKVYTVKSEDDGYVDLVGQAGFLFTQDLEVLPSLPKDTDESKKPDPKDDWTGKEVLPTKHQSDIPFGDWIDGKPVYFAPHNLMTCVVRDDRDGFLRVYDYRREGWVPKEDFLLPEDAPIYWDKIVKANPKDLNALWMRGIGWQRKKEYENAIKDFSECIRLEPSNSSYYNSRGIAWQVKKDYDKAIEDFTEAIRLEPNKGYYYHNRAITWHKKIDHDKAIVDYTEAIRLEPKYASAYRNRGSAWANKHDRETAIADYTEAIRLDPKDADSYEGRGIMWGEKKEYAKAISDYSEAIRLNPKDANSHNNIAMIKASAIDANFRDGKAAVELAKRSN